MTNDDKVTRYEFYESTWCGGKLAANREVDADGEYVTHDDYAKLESLCDDYERLCQKKDAELAEQASTIAALKEQLAGARNAALEEAAKVCDFSASWYKSEAADEQHREAIRHEYAARQGQAMASAAATRALASQPAAPVQPQVLEGLRRLAASGGAEQVVPEWQPSTPVPQFLVRKLEQAISEAKNPQGMHTNGPAYARIEVSQLEAIMARIGQQTGGPAASGNTNGEVSSTYGLRSLKITSIKKQIAKVEAILAKQSKKEG